MTPTHLQSLESASLPTLVSLPDTLAEPAGYPVLFFLHGWGEGSPMPLHEGLMAHGPMAGSSSSLTGSFIVVAAQLPMRGDIWHQHADSVREIAQRMQAEHQADPRRFYLTGFSFGGNGVFDLAISQPDLWAALWPVDPTRIPRKEINRPIWMSSGEASRGKSTEFIQRLKLTQLQTGEPSDRVYMDQALDHTGTATNAYQDDRIYRWLLSKRLTRD